MTNRQKQILLIIAGLEEEGKRPTCRAIARQVGISSKAVHDHLLFMAQPELALLTPPADNHEQYTVTHWGRYLLKLPVVPIIRQKVERRAAA
jgi:hypothetical protein